ncbi:MAG: hypothetical protein KBT11_07875 [Treponema sp.]|nr:hypothetical protein [Candidatus Treponema equifaecale]
MAKLTEKKTETAKATQALASQFQALNTIAEHENKKTESSENSRTDGRKDRLCTFNLPAEDYEKYKAWFGSKGLSMSMGLRMCLDYIHYNDKAENLIFTKSGIRENELTRLR